MCLATSFAWQAVGVEDGRKAVWKRVAYALRYSKGATLTEVMEMPNEALSALLEALGEIVEEENRANSAK